MSDAPAGGERVPLDMAPPAALRRRARLVAIGALIVAAAAGGVVGLFSSTVVGLAVSVAVAVPLLLLAWGQSRRRQWLEGSAVAVREFGTRRVDLRRVRRVELLVTQARGVRTVNLLVAGPPRGKTITVALASYGYGGGTELGIVALRRLADGLAGGEHTGSLVFSELLVAALRAEARGDAAADRPLYRLTELVGDRGLARRVPPEALSRFVTTLD